MRQVSVVPDAYFDSVFLMAVTSELTPCTRPLPAVSVPRAKLTIPRATATAEPELEPPGTKRASIGFRGIPNGERVPTKPVANWSRLVLPRRMAPAASSLATTVADSVGVYAKSGHPAVVGMPATSMLSFTAKVTPANGTSSSRRATSAARAAATSRATRLIQIAGSPASILAHAATTASRILKPTARPAGPNPARRSPPSSDTGPLGPGRCTAIHRACRRCPMRRYRS